MISLIEQVEVDAPMAIAVNKKFYALLTSNYMKFIEQGELRAGSEEADALFMGIRAAQSPVTPYLGDFDVVLHDMPKAAVTEWWKVFPEDENMAQHIGGLQSKQPLYVRIVLSNVFHIEIAVAIVFNCVYVLIDASICSDENATHAVWLVFELVFCVIFLVEAVLKITAMRVEYFRDGYNNFDFFLMILGIVGAALSILTVASAHPEETQAEDSVGGTSSEARIMRVARVFRILRFLRIFRLFHAKLSMDAEVSVDLSNHMKRISTMTVFVRGHLAAQVQLVKYFGGNGVVASEILNLRMTTAVVGCMSDSPMKPRGGVKH